MLQHRLTKFLLVVLLLITCSWPAVASAPSKSVLIVDIPRLLYSDINDDYPSLVGLAKSSASGLMVLPNMETRTLDKIYLELNSGNQLKVVDDGFVLLQVDEMYKGMAAGDLYRTLTGLSPPRYGGVNIGLSKLIQLNLANGGDQSIGLFGKVLHTHSYKTAVIGNADIDPQTLNRSGSILLMDQKGIVDFAAIGWETVASDPEFVFGIKTNTDKVLSFWEKFHGQAGVIHIILGDLERINEFSSYLPSPRLEFHRKQALRHIDQFMKELLKRVDFNETMLVVLSAAGPDEAKTGAKLNPVWIKTAGLRPGHLYSNSTRKAALVTGYDIIATVLDYLGINSELEYFKGRKLTSVPGEWQDGSNLQQKLTINYDVRWPILTVYGYLMILLVTAFIAGLIFWGGRLLFFRWVENIYLFLLTIPAVFLGEAVFNPADWFSILSFTFIAAGLLCLIVMRIAKGDQFYAFAIISLITVLAILADGITNGSMELYSFWGYSAVAGVRFYGIGNEYMGFLLGSYIMVITFLINRLPKHCEKYLWVNTILVALLLAHPGMGSNVGGGITALIGLGITNYLWLKRPVRMREILILLGSFLIFVLLIGCWDLSLNGKVTHFGQFLKIFHEEGFPALGQMISRKLQMNLELIEYTPLSRILIGLLLIVPIIYKKPPKVFAGWLHKYHTPVRGFMGLSITALVALLVNDSGIVSVATMFIFGVNMVMLLILKEKNIQGVERS